MRLAVHIFAKDAWRFWWEITVTLGLLLDLTYLDANRISFIPGPMEGWLNLLLPAAWAYLVALVIHDEAPVGERQFWLTRPYPWTALVTAKALFMLAFIQVPCFAADTAILVARGFQPIYYLPELLLKQLILAVVLTLSATSLATVTRNLPQFVLAGVVIVALGLFCVTRVEPFSSWVTIDQVRRIVGLLVLAPFGTVIVLLQYSRRRTALSRALGLGAILLAGMLFVYLPRSYTSAFESEAFPVPADGHASSVRVTPRDKPASYEGFRRNAAQIKIPIVISGMT